MLSLEHGLRWRELTFDGRFFRQPTDQIFEKTKALLSERSALTKRQVTPDAGLIADLGTDDLDKD